MKKKVSIIIRTIKPNENLNKAINSIEKNTYKEKEIIIVYQGILNSDLNFIRNLTEKYKTIEFKIIDNNQNTKDERAKNLNLGIKASTGEYLCFLDDDDEFKENHLTSLITLIENTKCTWAVSNFYKIDNHCKKIKSIKVLKNLSMYYIRNFIPINCYMINIKKFKENKNLTLEFNEDFIFFEDYEFLLKNFIRYNIYPIFSNSETVIYNLETNKIKNEKYRKQLLLGYKNLKNSISKFTNCRLIYLFLHIIYNIKIFILSLKIKSLNIK